MKEFKVKADARVSDLLASVVKELEKGVGVDLVCFGRNSAWTALKVAARAGYSLTVRFEERNFKGKSFKEPKVWVCLMELGNEISRKL